MILLTGNAKNAPRKTKSMNILNSGDCIAVARTGNMFAILTAPGNRKASSWDGFFIQKSAIKEVQAIHNFLTIWLQENQETPAAKSADVKE